MKPQKGYVFQKIRFLWAVLPVWRIKSHIHFQQRSITRAVHIALLSTSLRDKIVHTNVLVPLVGFVGLPRSELTKYSQPVKKIFQFTTSESFQGIVWKCTYIFWPSPPNYTHNVAVQKRVLIKIPYKKCCDCICFALNLITLTTTLHKEQT